MKSLKAALFITCIIGQTAIVSCAWPAIVNRDLLSSWGDFETPATIISFRSYYNGPDYDYDAEGRWSQPYNGSRDGYALPTENDTLGAGWRQQTKEYVIPDKNMICKLVRGGINDSSCQYAALKGLNNWGEISIYSRVIISSLIDYTGSNVKPGDKLVFKIDHIKMTDFAGLRATYSLSISQSGTSEKLLSQAKITASETPFATQLETTVVPDVDKVFVSIILNVDGGTADKTPAMYVDGAHLYVIRTGNSTPEKVEVPVRIDRSIKTMSVLWEPDDENDYSVASSSDYIIPFCHRFGNYSSLLRQLNPNVHIYSYFASNTIDMDAGPKTAWNATSIGYNYARTQHPEWLYTDGETPGKYVTVPGYPKNYFSKKTDPTYQNEWINNLLAKASKEDFDGVFVDEADPHPRIPAGSALPLVQPVHELADSQQFLHAITPALNASGYDIVFNDINTALTSGSAGRALLHPAWTPEVAYPESKGFSSNSGTNTPRCRFKEWSFLKPFNNNKPKNTYEKDFWLQCIKDMDEIGIWNTTPPLASLPDNKKTMLWLYTRGNESVGDPAKGNEGWLRFALCSYLIGQNNWTVFGYEFINCPTKPTTHIDYSITAKLGIPSGGHTAIQGDEYFRCRTYKKSPDFPESLGGVVVVNAYPDKSLQYVLASNAVDEDGNLLKKGSSVTIKPHTGRIFFSTVSDIVVSLVVPSRTVNSGQMLTIQVNYSNIGTEDAKNVTIKAAVPNEMTYAPGSAELLGGSYDAVTRIVSWVEPIVISGASGVKTFGAKVN